MRFHRESSRSAYDAIVVGSGLGGLTAGALLSRMGKSVLLVERHDRVGGYAHSFRRGAYRFDSAVHLVGGCNPESGGLVYRVLDGLDLTGRCEFQPIDTVYTASYPGLDFEIPSGLDEFVATHAKAFPSEAEGLRRLVEVCARVRDERQRLGEIPNPLAMVRSPRHFPNLVKYHRATLQQVVREHISDRRLEALFGTLWPYLGLPPSKLSFVYWAVMLMSYVADGAFYCKGSFQNFANVLSESITANGGEVLLRSPVRRIRVKDGKTLGITLENGQRIAAPVVISNSDLTQTVEELVGTEHFPARYVSKLRQMRPSTSAIVVYAATDLDLNTMRAGHETFLYPSWDHDHAHRTSEAGQPEWLSVTVPTFADPDLAPTNEHIMILTSLVRPDAAKDWRGEKQRVTNALLEAAEERFPGLGRHLTFVESGTPRTMERYTRNTDGAAYGWELSPRQVGLTRNAQNTPIDGLFLAGHWTQPGGGVYGVVASGVGAARRVLGFGGEAELWESLAASG